VNTVPAHRMRLMLTALALVSELAHLGWEHTHGGVLAHHLLNRADLPAISNWWGLLLIPALTWYLVGRMQRRLSQGSASRQALLAGFLGALAYGTSLALAFTMGQEIVTYLFLGLIVAALLAPAYRAEYVLGFVLGMTFTFGAVLPTFIACMLAAFSRITHWLCGSVWRLVQKRDVSTSR
jgi:hypothetical protein